jgi:peptidoglycan pentaglycine glycine transferase (the first glycine)
MKGSGRGKFSICRCVKPVGIGLGAGESRLGESPTAVCLCYNPPPMSDMFTLEEQEYSADDSAWDAFVAQHPHGSILQTTAWASLKSRFGWAPKRVWVKKEGQIVAGAQMLVRSAAMGMLKMGYVPHGPLVDWQNDELVAVLFNQLNIAAYQMRTGFVKIEPLLWEDSFPMAQWQSICERHHGRVAPHDSIQPPRTILLDLRPSPDDILAAMKQKTRYNIRLAEKKGITVRQGSVADLPAFTTMMRTTGQRNEFGVHVPKYYHVAYQQFATYLPGSVALFIAEYEGRPLAGVMAFALGRNAAYLYGASNNEERQRMPTYAVQWAAIQWAKAQGCDWYDLYGIPDEPEEKLEAEFETRDDGLWGVYRFKRGFGGQMRRTVGATDFVYNNLTYRLYQWRRGR